jgi:hypothetical protein
MSDPAVTEVAKKLAVECLAAQKEVGEDRLFMKVGEVVGVSSQTVEEAFLTAIRTRMAEIQGRDFLLKKIKAHRADKAE